ncbi:flagellar basal body L-ring protein FlgH [Buchnera aphidicola]|uniref:flagellar basal body L-ring protein FlgH n=1 Tax=Buchnera aphidicola TaxID=9 RepID=UPI0016515472|nr:flagellar basal body L-ring protein FlgH [Buchnera aphidicola]
MFRSLFKTPKWFFLVTAILALNGFSLYTSENYIDPVIKNYKKDNQILLKDFDNSVLSEDLKNKISSLSNPFLNEKKIYKIGETITLLLEENISASNSSVSSLIRNGNSRVNINSFPNPLDFLLKSKTNRSRAEINSESKNNFSGKGNTFSKNTFTGIITVTITDICKNGNLKIFGQKQISINQESEFIRFSGVINPENISINNVVKSHDVANEKIEYYNNGSVSQNSKTNWMQKLFFYFFPG